MKKPNRTLAAAVAIALSGGGIAYALAQPSSQSGPQGPATPAKDDGPVQISETLSGMPKAKQGEQMSEEGLTAARTIALARATLNDGDSDRAKSLLTDAQGLLNKVKALDTPVSVATKVRVGDKDLRSDKTTVTPDLIPILSEIQLVEAYDQDPAKVAAVAKAREHLKKGERKEAVDALRLAAVGLVTRDVSMPLAQTMACVDEALKLIDSGKPYEANLELKKVNDGLVETSDVVVEPSPAVAASNHAKTPDTSTKN